MWGVVREHLIVKIAIVVLATLALGFGIPALINARLQLEELERQSHSAADALARGLTAGVRTAMLTGNGITARSMVHDARVDIEGAELRIYAPNGEEVFGERPPAPAASELPAHIAETLQSAAASDAPQGAHAVPIANDKACQKCHPDGTLRGVLTLGLAPLDRGDPTYEVFARISEGAFEQLMTAEQEGGIDELFAEIVRDVDGIEGVGVFDLDGDQSFGEDMSLAAPQVTATMATGESSTHSQDGRAVHLRPLPNAPQCHACHEEEDRWRGVLAVAVRPAGLAPEASVREITIASLRHVMLAGLGRLIARFLDRVAETGAVTALTLHDAEGRLFRDAFAQVEPPALVSAVLADASEDPAAQQESGDGRFVLVAPLVNDKECRQCHGTDHPLRGAIEVVLDTSDAAASQRMVVTTGIAFGLATILLTIVLLYIGLRTLVLRPVSHIGDVAEKVGEGELQARVEVSSLDEIGRLGGRLNHMIGELRKKLELSKFVSKATVGQVDAMESRVERSGERQHITVLFSDIRGFTAFSETVEPEEVVKMLNAYLDAQSDVVERFGGDIDKFVGDELMATFHGEDMEARAVSCAVQMIAAVARVGRSLPPEAKRMSVGVGVNVGEVVFGAMGARERMDFTVIGDAVNLGARLCSAAAPGEVIVSAAVREQVGERPGIAFEVREPIEVKGKRAPIEIYRATAAHSATVAPTRR